MKVMIIGSELGHDEMFIKRGWDIADNVVEADLLQFTGGFDVDPSLYKQAQHPTTSPNPPRDKADIVFFNLGVLKNKPMAGICRGGQFLNVMQGGSLWQDINNHNQDHEVVCDDGEVLLASSSHHQAICRVGTGGKCLMTAKQSTRKDEMISGTPVTHMISKIKNWIDIEAVVYPEARILCFQPHPEYPGYERLKDKYFEYLEKFLLKG